MRRITVLHVAIAAIIAFALGWLTSTNRSAPLQAEQAEQAETLDRPPPAEVLVGVLEIEDPLERTIALAEFLQATDPASGLLLREQIEALRPSPVIDEVAETLFASWWAAAAPEAAFLHPINPPWTERHPWMRTVFREWARQDPIAAAEAIYTLPDGDTKGVTEGARSVVDAWVELDEMPDPTPLLGVIGRLKPMARGGALTHVASAMMKSKGVEETLEFVRKAPQEESITGNLQHELFARTGVALLEYDTQRAIEWVQEHADGPASTAVHKHLAYYWGLREGIPAVEWALSLPESAEKSVIIKRAWLSSARKHKPESEAWLKSRAPHPLMVGIYAPFVRRMAQENPEAALELAERMEDEEGRQRLQAAAGEGWMRKDPEAATEWLGSAGLPANLDFRVRSAATPRSP
jgi:hypothetical protein